MVFVIGLQSTVVHGTEYVVKDIAPAALFVIGGCAVPAVVAYTFADNEVGEQGLNINNKKPTAIKAAITGLIDGMGMVGMYYLLKSTLKTRDNILVALTSLTIWTLGAIVTRKELANGQSRVVDIAINTGAGFLTHTVGSVALVAAYYGITGKR